MASTTLAPPHRPHRPGRHWLAANRNKLIADLPAILSGPDQCVIENENLDRWNTWQRAVLQKLEQGNELAALVKTLRPSVDVESNEADQVAEVNRRERGSHRDGGLSPERHMSY